MVNWRTHSVSWSGVFLNYKAGSSTIHLNLWPSARWVVLCRDNIIFIQRFLSLWLKSKVYTTALKNLKFPLEIYEKHNSVLLRYWQLPLLGFSSRRGKHSIFSLLCKIKEKSMEPWTSDCCLLFHPVFLYGTRYFLSAG